ncbi:MAG: histidine kinase [Pseudomonadota bacterium]|nr:histidine kinase [Pseudomonadota bacterium]
MAFAADSLRGVRWSQVRGAMLFGLAATVFTALINWAPALQFARTMPMHLFFLGSGISDQFKALCLLAAIVVADRAVDQGARRRFCYVAAALAGCTAGILFGESFSWAWRTFVLPDQWPAWRPYLRGPGSLYFFPTYALTSWLLLGGPAVFFYADRRAALRTGAHLRAAELDRIRRSRLALESRLQAMQARVEPQFLFNTLAQVEHLYEQDPGMAARMLDDLIAYLRAAMPLMRSTSSTVGQEIELARTYLDIVKARLGHRLAFDIDVARSLSDLRMPPMILLPLIDHAITYGLEQSTTAGSIRIATEAGNGRLRLKIADSGAGFIPDAEATGIASIRERLGALYGGDARLDLRQLDAGATEAVMDIPCEM